VTAEIRAKREKFVAHTLVQKNCVFSSKEFAQLGSFRGMGEGVVLSVCLPRWD
jgi:hypothetical protein